MLRSVQGLVGKSSSDRRSTSEESGDSESAAGRSSISPRLVWGVAGVEPGIEASRWSSAATGG